MDPDWYQAFNERKGLVDQVISLRVLLRKCREYLMPCDRATVDCDDPDGGLKDKSQWCGGPCRLREEIRDALGEKAE